MRKVIYSSLLLLLSFSSFQLSAQPGVLDPSDPDWIFTAGNQPPAPTYAIMSKWGHSNVLNWDPYSYGYRSYYFKGMAFRIKFPKSYQHNVVDGKTYPMLLFMHGLGEYGPIYNNELQLLWGGQLHAQAVNNGNFDGFLLYPQSNSGYLQAYFPSILDLMDSLAKYVKLDIDRVTISGLSSGGQASWDFLQTNSDRFASMMPISAARQVDIPFIPSYITIPVWLSNGGLDNDPTPQTATDVVDTYKMLGGNIKQSFYPLGAHAIWSNFWAEPGYFPALRAAHKANPLVYFQHNQFCPLENIDAKMQLQPGFYAYQWDKDGVVIPGATTNTYDAAANGTYRARFMRTSTSPWSAWSPTPVVVSQKQPTITPPIQINGLFSNVLPAPDGSTTVPLIVPNTFAGYDWRRLSDNSLVSSVNTYDAPVGQYKVQVTEQFGCSSSYSAPFTVIAAAGVNVPDKATEVSAVATSNTTVQVYWNSNPNPIYNETGFEVYRSSTAGSGYVLVGKLAADILDFFDQNLLPNTTYYYIVRAVNDNGASPISNEASATTISDTQIPSAPTYLSVTGVTRHSVSIRWNAATDDVGISKYDIYVNGQKAFTTDLTDFTINNLDSFQTYSFYVRARDFSGNISVPSNQVSALTKLVGINYKYYEGTWSTLPDFNSLTPVKKGYSNNADISVRNQNVDYGILWEGVIKIPVTGTYKFETGSDDGSKLYIGNYSAGATPLVNNDGVHGVVIAAGSITLTAGVYPIAITYFQQATGQSMSVYWTCAAAGFPARTLIPDSYFGDTVTNPLLVPAMSSNLLVTAVNYNRVHITWSDNSSNETGFELYRKAAADLDYSMVALLPADATMYDDTTVAGATTYSYKIQAVNLYGPSGFNPADIGGIEYSYYQGNWNNLPNFSALTPVATGFLANYSIANALQPDNFAYKFVANINIAVTGTYTFYTASDDGSNLYLNTFDSSGLVVMNDYTQGTTKRSGSITLTAGRHPIFVTYFERNGGQALLVSYKRPGDPTDKPIPDSVFINKNTTATTPALPSVPLVPKYLSAQVITPFQINVSFKDSSTQTGYEVYRSVSSANNFHLYKTFNINDSIVSFSDSGLYANTIYYYKVRANGIGGFSAFSSTVSATTGNNAPAIAPVVDFAMYHSATQYVAIKATDIDGDILALSFQNLPSFASFSSTGNGTGNLIFTPNVSSDGLYNITVVVNDGHGGNKTMPFSVTVNNNQSPTMYRLRNITVDEGSASLTAMTASDPDRRTVLRWSLTNGPAFLSIRVTSDNTAMLVSAPGFADAGVYPFTITVSDGAGGVISSSANVTVINVETTTNDGTAPIMPSNLTATALADGSVRLSWTDIAYNESAYYVYRALTPGGTYTLLNSGASNLNDTTYIDNSAVGNTLYYYKIEAINGNGNSGKTAPVNVTTANKLPVVHTLNNIIINAGSQAVLNITSSDDPGEILVLSVTGLPSFATLDDLGNGSADITFQPQLSDVGTYSNITAQVSDNHGGVTTKQFSVTVLDNSFRSTYVNFSSQGGSSAPAPWNNYLNFPFANLSLDNLLDASGVNTGYSVKFLQQLTGNFTTGMAANNKGIYPDSVLLTSVYYSSSATAQLEFAGLNVNKKYNVVLLSSFNSGDDATATFTSGSQSVTLNGMYNSTKTVQLNGLVPNASGIIDVSFTKSASAINVMLNAAVLQEYSGTPLLRPADLFTESVLASNKVNLAWSDRSFNETGFEIWRSTSASGTFSLVTTTPANTTTYTDNGLTYGVKYYYQVRAVKTGIYSAYSNTSGTSVASQTVYLNWDINYNQPAPWNSTNTPPTSGTNFTNLYDTAMNSTGYEMLIVQGFNGEFYAGVTGGGIFPDNVMQSNYWTDASQTSQVKFNNLDQRKKYRIGVFGSATWYGFFNGNYTIDGTTLSVNSHNNNSKVIYFEDVTPNSDGEILLNISPDAGTPYCFTAAITIESYDPETGIGSGPIAGKPILEQPVPQSEHRSPAVISDNEVMITSVKAYPNPFTNNLKVDLQISPKIKQVALLLFDVNGHMLYTKVLGSNEMARGNQTVDLSMTKALPPGNYFLKVLGDGKAQQTIKLVKAR
ncbi:MAG: PA14 domain-containing protein [Ginsengibacter sp.]